MKCWSLAPEWPFCWANCTCIQNPIHSRYSIPALNDGLTQCVSINWIFLIDMFCKLPSQIPRPFCFLSNTAGVLQLHGIRFIGKRYLLVKYRSIGSFPYESYIEEKSVSLFHPSYIRVFHGKIWWNVTIFLYFIIRYSLTLLINAR